MYLAICLLDSCRSTYLCGFACFTCICFVSRYVQVEPQEIELGYHIETLLHLLSNVEHTKRKSFPQKDLEIKKMFHHVGFHSFWIVLDRCYRERATVRVVYLLSERATVRVVYLLSETACCVKCCGYLIVSHPLKERSLWRKKGLDRIIHTFC